MNAGEYWDFFVETGAPEFYLMYLQAKKQEDTHVFDHSGHCASGDRLQ